MNKNGFQLHLNSKAVYCTDILSINKILNFIPRFYKDRHGREYMNVANAFDIETTSTEYQSEDIAFMYIWQMGINGYVIYGRTWDEWLRLLGYIQNRFQLNENRIMVVGVHNLSFEFQFIRKRIEWSNVFAIDDRVPVRALSVSGFEFRCTYLLSGKSLEKVGSDLTEFNVRKLVGGLDYSLVRTKDSILSETELEYCFDDVRVVMAYLQEKMYTDGSIVNIPMTKTGYVRKYIRSSCLHDKNVKKYDKSFREYRKLMSKMSLTRERYDMLKRAFQGGFTHANAFWVDKTLYNIHSFDFSSSYPFCLLAFEYPMNGGEEYRPTSYEDFKKQLNLYCCLFDIEFFDLIPKQDYDHPISEHKCMDLQNYSVDNGRIISAEHLMITITEQDFFIYEKFYDWSKMRIHKFVRYERAYLPTEFVKGVIKLYLDKTMLKGVIGKEVDYQLSKEMLNSTYGMTVTDICRDDFIYTDEWSQQEGDYDSQLEKYNKSYNRFLSYEWGQQLTRERICSPVFRSSSMTTVIPIPTQLRSLISINIRSISIDIIRDVMICSNELSIFMGSTSS